MKLWQFIGEFALIKWLFGTIDHTNDAPAPSDNWYGGGFSTPGNDPFDDDLLDDLL